MLEITPCEQRPGVFRLRAETTLSASRETVFAFFSDAANLSAITPPWLNFRITTPLPIDMAAGTLIDYRLRIRGLPIRWQTEISVWEPPYRFADRQRRGPYRLWEHTHEFETTPTGTVMRDSVDYAVLGGAFIERWFVRPDIKKIFAYRNDQISARFGQDAGRSRTHDTV